MGAISIAICIRPVPMPTGFIVSETHEVHYATSFALLLPISLRHPLHRISTRQPATRVHDDYNVPTAVGSPLDRRADVSNVVFPDILRWTIARTRKGQSVDIVARL